MGTDSEYIDAKAAAALLGFSRAHVYNLVEKGVLHPSQPGGRKGELRFKRSEVEAVRDRPRGQAA